MVEVTFFPPHPMSMSKMLQQLKPKLIKDARFQEKQLGLGDSMNISAMGDWLSPSPVVIFGRLRSSFSFANFMVDL